MPSSDPACLSLKARRGQAADLIVDVGVCLYVDEQIVYLCLDESRKIIYLMVILTKLISL